MKNEKKVQNLQNYKDNPGDLPVLGVGMLGYGDKHILMGIYRCHIYSGRLLLSPD